MLTIGIVFWDGDYKNYDTLIERLKERVHIPYEVIIIDNTEGNKLGNKADFSFGYNAYQFAARYHIIEKAKGEYIWFIDGDDDIKEIDDFPYTEDVIVFGAETIGVPIKYKDNVIKKNIFTYKTVETLQPVLWNKFIKRSLYDLEVLKPYKDLQIVPNEDTIWGYVAIKNAKSIKTVDKTIYIHKEGFSNKVNNVLLSDIKHVTCGYKESMKILEETIGDADFYNNVRLSTNIWLLAMAFRSEDIIKALEILSDYITIEQIKECFSYMYIAIPEIIEKDKQKIKETIKKTYGEDFFIRRVTSHNWFDDGHEEDVTIEEEWW